MKKWHNAPTPALRARDLCPPCHRLISKDNPVTELKAHSWGAHPHTARQQERPVEDRRRVRAILPYTKVPETDEISFLKGDMFIVHNELEDGWMWVTNLRTDEQGLIVEDLVEEVGREEDPHEGKIWFHGKISKQEAYNLLMTVGQVCSFLIRPSDNTPGDYSLYFRTSENIQRFKICPTSNNQFMMGGRYYNR
ncbi:ras GTPase-activating protein 1-like [Phasianus colchicus]|uniref:ras GTPase-activating protein 1-like n=1 Tax=Phasianus colchicus TaxID=9054 RepID=UPI00129E90F3|nr:ras GTPase-activating protein 1-like [Phasianus colchicus]